MNPRTGQCIRSIVLPAIMLAVVGVWIDVAKAQTWDARVRGSWVREGESQAGDVDLTRCKIVVAENEAPPVHQAAKFLQQDLDQLRKPQALPAVADTDQTTIHLITLGAAGIPDFITTDKLNDQWEAYHIRTSDDGKNVYLVGSNARGTAFAAYTLSERLGIDPLQHWTGYQPTPRKKLFLRKTDQFVGPPTFKYRGMFHDDEDILPRPFEYSGYPLRTGDVPTEWYAKFFETALRLRMNMVAPYTRTHRRFEVQKMASDWGLFYTSHHYDILLSNPFGYERFELAKKRGMNGEWSWDTNRDGMLRYWRGGVEENKSLDCIWPVGLRGTDDGPYNFPKGTSDSEQGRVFNEAIAAEIETTRELVPQDKPPVFHFTLYSEMLDKYLAGNFDMSEDVILIWTDDNDGRMRALPKAPGKWKHGVYYHAAYLGQVAPKQSAHVVPPARIANEFKKIVDSGATEYMLLNVSELREFVMEARMIADITWDAKAALHDTPSVPASDEVLPRLPTTQIAMRKDPSSPSADRFTKWWSAEYFGDAAADDVVTAYGKYFELLDRWDQQMAGSEAVQDAIATLRKRFVGATLASPSSEPTETRATQVPLLQERAFHLGEACDSFNGVREKLTRAQRQYFFEHVELPLLMDYRPTQAALLLRQAIDEPDRDKAWQLCEQAMVPLVQFEGEIALAERPPFDGWYRKTWIRRENRPLNVHRPFEQLRAFLASDGKALLHEPEAWRRPDLSYFRSVLQEEDQKR